VLVRGADNVKPTTATYRLRPVAPERLAGWQAGPEQHPIDLSANREGSLLDTSEEEMDRGKTQITQRVAMFVVATLTLSTTLNAQRPLDRTIGFVLGIHTIGATGLTVSGADMEGDLTTSFGAGAGLMVGYGFTKSITGYASFDVAKQGPGNGEFDGNLGLSHVEVGARAYLPLGMGATMPYVTGSFGRRALAARVTDDFNGEYDMSFSGTAFGIGGGFERAISPALAFDGGVEATFGRFNRAEIADMSGSIDLNGTTSIRLRAGMTWRPGRSR
jgi:hypothetical protein